MDRQRNRRRVYEDKGVGKSGDNVLFPQPVSSAHWSGDALSLQLCGRAIQRDTRWTDSTIAIYYGHVNYLVHRSILHSEMGIKFQ